MATLNRETTELFNQLSEICNKSLDGEILWTQPTPSTFQWVKETNSGPLLVTIQRAASTIASWRALAEGKKLEEIAKQSDYLFQIQEASPRRILVALSSKERPELARSLADVYSCAERGVEARTNQIIGRLLE